MAEKPHSGSRVTRVCVRQTVPPVGGGVVAVVGQQVVVELPEDVQRDAAVGGRHVVVGLPQHGVKVVQRQVLRQQLVGQAVGLQQALQLLSKGNAVTVQDSRCKKIVLNAKLNSRIKRKTEHF